MLRTVEDLMKSKQSWLARRAGHDLRIHRHPASKTRPRQIDKETPDLKFANCGQRVGGVQGWKAVHWFKRAIAGADQSALCHSNDDHPDPVLRQEAAAVCVAGLLQYANETLVGALFKGGVLHGKSRIRKEHQGQERGSAHDEIADTRVQWWRMARLLRLPSGRVLCP